MLRAWITRIGISGFEVSIDKRQLLVLCLCSTVTTFNGTITVNLMPVYTLQLGADAAMTGIFVAASFMSVTIGNIIGGWLSDHMDMRKPILLIAYAVWSPTVLLITQAYDVVTLTLITALCWLPGGLAIAICNAIAGLSAVEGERGKVFGWIKVFAGIGGLLAGVIGGLVIERWGWPMLFMVMAAIIVVMLAIATQLDDKPAQGRVAQTQVESNALNGGLRTIGAMLMLLLASHLLVRLSQLAGGLAAPLTMTELGFDAAAVSSAIAVSAMITLPLPFVLGWLSDRAGRKRFLIFCYAAGMLGLLVMIPAVRLWHFWLSTSLISISNSASGVAQAYVVDLVPRQAIGRSLSLFSTISLFAGVVGLGGAGFLMQNLGTHPALLSAASLSLVAIFLMVPLRMPASMTRMPEAVQT